MFKDYYAIFFHKTEKEFDYGKFVKIAIINDLALNVLKHQYQQHGIQSARSTCPQGSSHVELKAQPFNADAQRSKQAWMPSWGLTDICRAMPERGSNIFTMMSENSYVTVFLLRRSRQKLTPTLN